MSEQTIILQNKERRERLCIKAANKNFELKKLKDMFYLTDVTRGNAKKTLRSLQNLYWNSKKDEMLKPIIQEATEAYKSAVYEMSIMSKEIKLLKRQCKRLQRNISLFD